jgi:esterase/lipase superfamily enzyme
MLHKQLAVFRIAIVFAVAVNLAACASRPGPAVLETVRAVPAAKQIKVYAVTTRNRVMPDSNVFDSTKAVNANYAELTISIPPNHKPSEIEWPGKKPNAAKDFAVVGQSVLDRQSFLNHVNADSKATGKVGVFVHGYNYNFQESLFRLAQISADANIGATPISFSWPSQGAIAGYVADKESATYSRDYLADLMANLTEGRGTDDVFIFGHSMGGWLVVEALRQLKLEGRDDVLSRLIVILAAPDIDADVFRTQMRVIGKMKHPITILVAGDDRALAVSKVISASTQRVGTLDVKDPKVQAAAVEAGVELIDISQIEATDSARHSRFVDARVLFPALSANAQRNNGINKAGAFVFDAAAATISSPFRIVSGVLKQGE